MNIINIVNKNPLFAQWQQQLKEGTPRQLLTGLSGSAKTLAIAGAYRQLDQPILVVTANLFYAYQLAEDLRNVEEEVYVFPVNEVISAEMAFSSPERSALRHLMRLLPVNTGFILSRLLVFVNFYQIKKRGKVINFIGKLGVRLTVKDWRKHLF